MNNEYVYKDGKALIIDENDNQKTVDYYDNLDDVLVQEDVIEQLENEIKQLEDELSSYKKPSKFSRWLWILMPFLIFTFVPLIFSQIMGPIFLKNMIIEAVFFGSIKTMDLIGIIMSATFSPFGAFYSLMLYKREKEIDKEQNGKKIQLEYSKKELVQLKEEVEQLKLDKTNSKKTEEFYVSKVDSKEELKKLRNYLVFCYNLGYNEQKYFKYYQQGKLDRYLEKTKTDAGIKFINKHFEEKGPTLVKKKKQNKNNQE